MIRNKMKKILRLIYSSNEWYDDLPIGKRELFFVLTILAPTILVNFLLYVYALWLPMLIWFVVFYSWRLPYVFRVQKTYVFDIETQGLHNTSFDYAFMIEQQKKRTTEKPEIIDTLKLAKDFQKKNEK